MITSKQKAIDLIAVIRQLPKDCTAKEMKEYTKLFVDYVGEGFRLNSIRKDLRNEGFSFDKEGYFLNHDERLESLQKYYNANYNSQNRKRYESIKNKLDEYGKHYSELIDFKEYILKWCENKYNHLISQNSNFSVHETKHINQISNDIKLAYDRWIFNKDDLKVVTNKVRNNEDVSINKNHDELNFFKFEVRSSDLIPKQIKLNDYNNVAVCDVNIKELRKDSNIKADKRIEITVVTPESNIISGYGINNNVSCDKIYQDYITVDLSLPSEEIIEILKSAKESGKNISLK